MEDKWYSVKCRIALARELDVAPDDLDVEPILQMIESSCVFERDGEFTANLMPDNIQQEEAITNQYYEIIIDRIFNNEAPFVGFLPNIIHERGLI